ncbi:hypothetical protein BGZ79_003012 [Entomortierella chlamydospora]|nr:hypothetical protein BGZ79_003012 [Entomortierella chlamydospora]
MAHQTPDMYEQQSSSGASSAPAVSSTPAQNALTLQQQQQQQFAQDFWEEQILAAEQSDSDFKNHPLPLARIKKVMKSDPEVKIFICEITRRAWLHAEENKRRTLQRSDVSNAVSRSDQFDFLIDIVPREEPSKPSKRSTTREDSASNAEVFEDQQQQYGQYYSQGNLAGYAHAIEAPSLYQPMSSEQFEQYVQYQQQAAAAQSYQPQHQQHQAPSSRGGSAGYARQEPVSRQG